jgi:hypothetical protein
MAICASTARINMTQDEINQMVEQAGFHGMLSIGVVMDLKQLEAFAKLVAAKALSEQERNFCSRCGKRTKDLTHIHTCTPPQELI